MPKVQYQGRAHRRGAPANERHCGELEDHAPHADLPNQCPGGSFASPGATQLKGSGVRT